MAYGSVGAGVGAGIGAAAGAGIGSGMGSAGNTGGSEGRIKTLLDWVDPRKKKKIQTEGRTLLEFEEGEITQEENTRRLGKISAQEAKFKKEDLARSKIKPIKDPEGDKSTGRRKSAKRKQAGRAGTLLSQGRETLG